MFIRFLLSITFLIGFSSILFGQGNPTLYSTGEIYHQMAEQELSFWEIRGNGLYYLENFPTDSSFAKKFGRWTQFWESKVDVEGDFVATKENYLKLGEPGAVCDTGGDGWTQLGPFIPNIQSMGIIVSIYSPEVDHNVIYAGSNSGGAWKTEDGGLTWDCITDDDNGIRIPALGVQWITGDPQNADVVYIATGKTSFRAELGVGVLKSIDGGSTWIHTDLSFQQTPAPNGWYPLINKVIVDPNDSDIVYAISDDEVFRTTNGGGFANDGVDDWPIVVDNLNSIPQEEFIDLEFSPTSSNVLYLSSRHDDCDNLESHIWRLTFDGQNWQTTDITPGINPNDPIVLHSSMNLLATSTLGDPDHIYLKSLHFNTCTDDDVPILRWHEVNETWESITLNSNCPTGFNFRTFEVNDLNSDVMYGGDVRLWKDDNGDGTFQRVTDPTLLDNQNHDDIRAIQIFESSQDGTTDHVVIGTDGGVNVSTNGGALGTWISMNGTDANNGLVISQFYDIDNSSIRPGLIAGGTHDNSYFRFDNGQWIGKIIGPCGAHADGGQTVIDWNDPNVVYTRFNQWLRVSYDGGDQFCQDATEFDFARFHDFNLTQHPRDPNILYIGKNHLFRTITRDPANNTFTETDFNFATTFGDVTPMTDLAISDSSPENMYASFLWATGTGSTPERKFFRSDNGGASFTDISQNIGLGPGSIYQWFWVNDIEVHPEDPNQLWIGFSNFNENAQGEGIDRIFYSNDAGDTWSEFSAGLPSVPVNKITYQKGSNGVLFCGTDVGVFRYNPAPGVERWECFNNGLPVCIVSDVEIDYCQNLIHIGTFGRGIYETNLPPAGPTIISSDETIDDGQFVHSAEGIIVNPGIRYTVEGTLNMSEGTTIIVERGAELVVNGGTITNRCDDMWKGIEIRGDNSTHQWGTFPNNPQGKVVIRNGAVIEHAELAITNWVEGDITSTGGIIEASGSIFRNNRQDIFFMPYQNTIPTSGEPTLDYSDFSDCEFILNDDPENGYRGGDDIRDRVFLGFVFGIDFTGCRFDNQNPALSDNQVAGINSFDSRFSVQGLCNVPITFPPGICPEQDLVRSSFTNLHCGIRAQRIQSNHSYRVEYTDFDGSVRAIMSENVDDFIIKNCNFTIGNGGSDWFNHGLMINTGTGYTVQENQFLGPNEGSNPVQPYEYGLVIFDSGASENLIDFNTYDGLFVANLALGNNSDISNFRRGLQYNCDTQVNCFYDIVVHHAFNQNGQAYGSGIRFFQGNPNNEEDESEAAQNIFSNNNDDASVTEEDFYNHADFPVQHFFDDNTPNTFAQEATFNWISQVQAQNANQCIIEEPGRHKILSASEKDSLKQDVDYHDGELLNAQYLYYTVIDEGNQPELVNNIQFEWSTDAWELRDQLIARSPNLSQETLLEAAMTGILPDALLMEVLLANIGSVKDQEFLDKLQNGIPNPLPQYMIDILASAPEPETLRLDLEEKMAFHSNEVAKKAKRLIQNAIIIDTIPDQLTFVDLLHQINTPESHLALAEHYLTIAEFDSAQQVIDSLQNRFQYIDRNQEYYQDYQQVFAIKKQTLQAGSFWDKLTASDIQTLENIANTSGLIAEVQAHNILRYANGHIFDKEPIIPPGAPAQQIILRDPFDELNARLTEVVVYPNPARDYVTIEYKFPEYIEDFTIIVSDITGRTVLRKDEKGYVGQYLWDTRKVGQGIFFINILSGKSTMYSGKVAIEK
ncbi:MAG: T9SS type A sorting domain-containing protein [Bacteroidota bacterium]